MRTKCHISEDAEIKKRITLYTGLNFYLKNSPRSNRQSWTLRLWNCQAEKMAHGLRMNTVLAEGLSSVLITHVE